MENQNVNENLKYALEYYQKGFSVIPVGKDKKPLINWKENQSKKADEARIRSWFAKHAKANVGIVTGKISGLVVVDVEAGGNIDDLPKTVTSRTGGGGWHLYYKYDLQRPVKNYARVRELTDIRGDGGYVVAPPSVRQSGNFYTWLIEFDEKVMADFPYWLIESLIGSSSSSLRSEDFKVSQNIEVVTVGARNDTAAKMAGKITYNLDQSLWETVGWSQLKQWNITTCKPILEEMELRNVWDSIAKLQQNKIGVRPKANLGKNLQIEIYAKRFRDGRLIEAFYDQETGQTGLLSFEDGNPSKSSQLMIDGEIYVAPPASNRLIVSGFVKLPSDATPYQSEFSLLQEIKGFIHEFIQIPYEFEQMASFYVLFSWVYDEFQELPYLRAIGDFGSGKSRFLKVMGALCYKSIFLNGAASSSAIFRMINEIKGTIILDEADFRFSDTSSEIIKILNSGFQQGIPVFRSEAKASNIKSFDPTPYDVFCPKILATRRNFADDALESRCLNNVMETLTREDIVENLDENFEMRALSIRNKLLSFRFQKLKNGISKVGLPKMNIEPRLKQIINPIYRVIADDSCKKVILDFIHKKQLEVFNERFNSFEGELFQAFLILIEVEKEPTVKEITDKYNELFGGKFVVKSKKVGGVFEQIFHLPKKRTARGYCICNNEENERRIIALKIKFGVEKQELNVVNNVNLSEEASVFDEAQRVFGLE